MVKTAKAKKPAQNKQKNDENVDGNAATPDEHFNNGLNGEEQLKNEAVALNADTGAKPKVKTVKPAKEKKESKAKSTKKADAKKAPSIDEDSNENDAPAEPTTKKRAGKKKLEADPENETTNKRNKEEPVSDDTNKGENAELEVKKRGRKEPAKKVEKPKRDSSEPVKKVEKPKRDLSEPAKKRAKKNEDIPATSTEKDKKTVRGKKAAEEPKVEEKTQQRRNPRAKSAQKSVEPEEQPEPEKSGTKKKAAKDEKAVGTKKAVPKKKVDSKKESQPEDKVAAVEKPEKTVATKKAELPAKAAKVKATKKDDKPAVEKKLQNSVKSDFNIDFEIEANYSLKIATWNISGLRSCVDKGCVDYFKHENADIICINEIKCGTEQEIPDKMKLDGYHAYWNVGKGMSGVGILSKQMPMEVFYDLPGEFSEEKRLITAEYKKYYVVCCYVVNAGRGLKTLDKRLDWNQAFDDYVKELDKKKPVIIAGDLNVAHNEIDLTNPKPNQKNAGFTKEERDGFSTLLSYGFVDTFRSLYPDQKGAYTFWSYMNNARSKNVGWRLDYFVTSERIMDKVKDSVIRSTIKGSDHCPIVLFLDI